MTERLVWIDCEMTGLDLEADALIEVAALVTDFDLQVLGEGVDIVIKPPRESLDQMVEFVQRMHDTSGLIEELRYYREAIFVPSPGPESAVAKEIAARHGGSLTGVRPGSEHPE